MPVDDCRLRRAPRSAGRELVGAEQPRTRTGGRELHAPFYSQNGPPSVMFITLAVLLHLVQKRRHTQMCKWICVTPLLLLVACSKSNSPQAVNPAAYPSGNSGNNAAVNPANVTGNP